MDKYCESCESYKDEKDFAKKIKSKCKDCYNQYLTEYNRKFKKENPEKAKRQLTLGYARKRKLRNKILSYYSRGTMRCEICKEWRPEFLSIDHINGDGNEHRKSVSTANLWAWIVKNNFPENMFRVLCNNCNTSSGYHGVNPHERRRAEQSSALEDYCI